MELRDILFIFSSVMSLAFGLYIGFKSGFNYGYLVGSAKIFLRFTRAIEKANADKTKEEVSEILDKIGKEYETIAKKATESKELVRE